MYSDNQTQIRRMMGEFYKNEFNELALKYEKMKMSLGGVIARLTVKSQHFSVFF